MDQKQAHWEAVYKKKQPHEVSWTQSRPAQSLEFIANLDLPLDASIIDIGGGDSKLVDHLLERGYRDITVLDISKAAIDRAKNRLGEKADSVKWIVSAVEDFQPQCQYDLWHDRATFHFLTRKEQVEAYVEKATKAIKSFLIVATFSENGPEKCSGLPIKQ